MQIEYTSMSKSNKKQLWVSEEIYDKVAAYGNASDTMETALEKVLTIVERNKK